MKLKTKISARKVLQVLVTVVMSACCIVAMVSASGVQDKKMLKAVAIHIKNDRRYHFVQEQEIMDRAVNSRQVDVMHTPLSSLDLHGIEQAILTDAWIADAQVYVDNSRVLHMYITQRIPVARIFDRAGNSCYMDATLHTMPLSASNIYYTMVVTNVPELKNDSISTCMKRQIYTMVRRIQADTFWSAQVSQVVVDSMGMFELVPTLGNQRIVFGDTSAMTEKFSNLLGFYKNVLNRIGWDKYETLDVRFKDQVVASPSLPYKGPVDKAAVTMNWINSIVETEAKKDNRDSVKKADAKVEEAEKAQKKKEEKHEEKKPVAKKDSKGKKKEEPAKKPGKNDHAAHAAPAHNVKAPDKKKLPKYVYPENKSH